MRNNRLSWLLIFYFYISQGNNKEKKSRKLQEMVYRFYDGRHQCSGAAIRVPSGHNEKKNARTTLTFPKKVDLVYNELQTADRVDIK